MHAAEVEALPLWDRLKPKAASVSPPRGMRLRGYQLEADAAITAKFAAGDRSTLAVMATGLGKTVLLAHVAANHPGRVLVVAHRTELVTQNREKIERYAREPVAREQSGWWAASERIVMASVQTLKGERKDRFKLNPFSLVIVDEAHHATAKSYRAILDTFPEAKVLGVTATPDRADGKAMGAIFDSVAYHMEIDRGIASGWLTPFRASSVTVDTVDLSNVSTSAGDLAAGELDEEMLKSIAGIGRPVLEQVGKRRSVIFTPGVKTAHALAEYLNSRVPGSAHAVDGKTEDRERASIVAAHKRGDFQFLVNCMVFTEGYDDPGVQAVVIARPTKSRALYTQMAGRGTRPHCDVDSATDETARKALIAASQKPDCLLLDIGGNAGRHTLICLTDILGGDYDLETRQKAKTIIEQEPATLLEDALEQAKEHVSREREALRRMRERVTYGVHEIDPFDVMGMKDPSKDDFERHERITPGQISELRRLCIPVPKEATLKQAQKLIGSARKRVSLGLATFGQISWFRGLSNPIDARQWTYMHAADVMKQMQRQGIRPVKGAR